MQSHDSRPLTWEFTVETSQGRPPRRLEWANKAVILGAFSFFSRCLCTANVVLTGTLAYYLYVVAVLRSESEWNWYFGAILVAALVYHLLIITSKTHKLFDSARGIVDEPTPKTLYRLFGFLIVTLI